MVDPLLLEGTVLLPLYIVTVLYIVTALYIVTTLHIVTAVYVVAALYIVTTFHIVTALYVVTALYIAITLYIVRVRMSSRLTFSSFQERRWAMENFIPKRTSLVGLTPSDDQATADIIPSTGGNSRDCFDTVSLFDGLAVKPFLDNDLNLTNPIAAPCHAVSQQTAAGEK